jgi:fumarate reductase subunit D
MEVLVLAAALWFGLKALSHGLAAAKVASPAFWVFLYCLISALLIAYEGGWLHR